MTETGLEAFDTTLQKTNLILKAIMDRFGWEDRRQAYDALRAVLHTLRNRLTPEHAAGFSAQLPMLVRGLYFDGWRVSEVPIKMNREEFLDEIGRQIVPPPSGTSMEEVTRGVLAIVATYTDPNEMRKIKATLPSDIQDLLEQPA